MMTAAQAKAIAARYQKAVELVEAGRVYRLYGEEDRYVVVNGNGQAYLVDLINGECTCPDAQYRASRLDILCKHALAAAIVHEQQAPKGAGGNPQPQVINPDAACQRCGMTVETDQLYCEPCQRLVEQGLAETLCRYHNCQRVATRGAYCAVHAPAEPEPDDDEAAALAGGAEASAESPGRAAYRRLFGEERPW